MRSRLLLGLVICLCCAAPAAAATPAPPTGAAWPFKQLPPGVTVTQAQAVRVAEHRVGPGRPAVYFARSTSGVPMWEVAYAGRRNVLTEVDVDARSGRILHAWTGWHANYRMSRGHFGALADSWWVWLPLCLLFVAPFFDFRRPLRLLHLDLLMLLAFGVSHLFFNRGNYLASVPLVYPVLGYLLVRMLWLGFRPRAGRGPLVPHARASWLVVGIVVLVAFRVFVNVDTAKVLDIGQGGVAGAGAIEKHRPIYVGDRLHRDTYGPLNYIAYVPFVRVSPSSLYSPQPPAAHLASIFFDLLVLLGLFMAGRRLRAGPEGTKLGAALAFAWAAYPYTLYALALNTNDALVAALLVFAFVALRSAPRRGVLIAAGAAAKFVPLVLAPLFATGTGERRARPLGLFAGALVATLALLFVPFMPHSGPRGLWDLTVGYQLHRQTPYSLWTLYPSLGWLKALLAVGAVGLAVAVAFVPRRREPAQVAALAAAVLIAVQLPSAYWFYFYVVWFAPFVFIALFASQLALDIPPSIQIPSGTWELTPSSSPTSWASPPSQRPKVTTAPQR